MPGRQLNQGVNIPGATITGNTVVNGYTVPVDLSVSSRIGTLGEYVATGSVEFSGEFESSVSDEFTAYISDASYAGSGNLGAGLSGSGGSYRYGFNGKENDNEAKGIGNQQDYGMRIYDPRAGKFLSVDPLLKSFPWYTPYQFSGNKPIAKIDLDGLEEASPEEKLRATSHLQTIKPLLKSNPHIFQNISPDKLGSDLSAIINDPASMLVSQNPANFCGIYAFAYTYALYEPTRFIDKVSELYVSGSTTLGSTKVDASADLREAKEIQENHSPAAFILGGSIRSNSNGYLSYDGLASGYWGSTNSQTMKSWLTNLLGVKVSEFSYGEEYLSDGINSKDLRILSDHLNSGKQAVLRVNSGTYNSSDGSGYSASGDLAGGDHWIVLNGKMKIDDKNSTVTFSAYDNHSGKVQKTFTIRDFKDMINHVLMVERKEPEKKQ